METRGVEQSVEAMAIAGDRRAIEAVWSTNRRWVAGVVSAHKPRHFDLDDLLQDVAMSVATNIMTVRSPGHVRAWLRTVAINAVRTAARKAHVRPQMSMEEADHDDPSLVTHEAPSDPDGGAVSRIEQMVHRLPIEYREPLMLRAIHGFRTLQIAEILEVAPPTVDTRIARARRMLREQLELAESPPSVAGAIHPASDHDGPTTTTMRDERITRGSRP